MFDKLLSMVINNVREHLLLYICLSLVLLGLDIYFFFLLAHCRIIILLNHGSLTPFSVPQGRRPINQWP
ncbi:DUF2770 family protein [Yersinia pestis subsp. pestis]|nr:DUF2770 family protein [Yersinia pestis subsp. pestis]